MIHQRHERVPRPHCRQRSKDANHRLRGLEAAIIEFDFAHSPMLRAPRPDDATNVTCVHMRGSLL